MRKNEISSHPHSITHEKLGNEQAKTITQSITNVLHSDQNAYLKLLSHRDKPLINHSSQDSFSANDRSIEHLG